MPSYRKWYRLKVLSYWNLNVSTQETKKIKWGDLKYYHIGI